MAYKKKTPAEVVVIERITTEDNRPRYMVTDPIQGMINNRKINAERGDVVILNENEYNTFKNSVLLIPKE